MYEERAKWMGVNGKEGRMRGLPLPYASFIQCVGNSPLL